MIYTNKIISINGWLKLVIIRKHNVFKIKKVFTDYIFCKLFWIWSFSKFLNCSKFAISVKKYLRLVNIVNKAGCITQRSITVNPNPIDISFYAFKRSIHNINGLTCFSQIKNISGFKIMVIYFRIVWILFSDFFSRCNLRFLFTVNINIIIWWYVIIFYNRGSAKSNGFNFFKLAIILNHFFKNFFGFHINSPGYLKLYTKNGLTQSINMLP